MLFLFSFLISYASAHDSLSEVVTSHSQILSQLHQVKFACEQQEKSSSAQTSRDCLERKKEFQSSYAAFESMLLKLKSQTVLELQRASMSGGGCHDADYEDVKIANLEADLSVVVDLIMQRDLKDAGLDSYLEEQSLRSKRIINREIDRFISLNMNQLIQSVCEVSHKKYTDFDQLFRDHENEERNLDCLGKISRLWENPEKIYSFLSRSIFLKQFIEDARDPLDGAFAVMSYLKHVRAEISKAYFRVKFLDDLESEIQKISGTSIHAKTLRKDLQEGMSGFGFNRMFSFWNALGVSPASDVDFKVIFDKEYFDKKKLPVTQDLLVRVLKKSEELFSKRFSMTLEVEKFTVKEKADLKRYLEKNDETELNFFSSILRNSSSLFGNYQMRDSFFNDVKKVVKTDVYKRTHRQYIGEESDKGSIGVLKKMEIIRRSSLEVGDPEHLKYEKLRKTFHGPYIGIPHEGTAEQKAQETDWIFSNKYCLLRLYDLNPFSTQAEWYNELGINFQYFLVDMLYKKKMSREEIDKKYDKITADDFYHLLTKYPNQIEKLFENACIRRMVSEKNCIQMKEIQSQKFSQDSEKTASIKKLGYRFFNDLFQSADRVGEELRKSEF